MLEDHRRSTRVRLRLVDSNTMLFLCQESYRGSSVNTYEPMLSTLCPLLHMDICLTATNLSTV